MKLSLCAGALMSLACVPTPPEPPDAGEVIDAGSPDAGHEDAGEPVIDAGDVVVDAGLPEADAGEIVDAGPEGPVFDIVFASNRTGEYDLFGAALGSAPVRLTTAPELDLAPASSPDGATVAYASTRSGALDLWLLDLETLETTALTSGLASAINPSFAPDGASLVFEGTATPGAVADVYRINVDGTGLVALTSDPARDVGPVVAPDATVYFVSTRSGSFEVWAMNPDGTDQRQVSTSSGILGKPAVSPDSLSVAWSRIGANGKAKVVILTLADGTIVDVSAENDSEPAFSLDGTSIAFTSLRTGNPEVFMKELGTSTVTQVTNDPAIDGTLVFLP